MMNNNQIRPTLSPTEAAAMRDRFQQMNPQMFARLQAMRPDILEPGNEHLLAAAVAAAAAAAANVNGGHGHSHSHSSSCNHAHSSPYSSQPASETVPNVSAADMAIVQAVQYNEIDRVKELVESGQVDVNTPDNEGCYLIHWASINNHAELLRYLISKGGAVNNKGGDLQSTPIHWACRQGCTDAFFVLVDNGALIDSTDTNGVQPIHIASQYGQIKILAYLLGSGIEVDSHDGKGFTPLIYSCIGPPQSYVPLPSSTHVCCTQFLITFGANINYQEPITHYTALHVSINNQNPISFHVLLKNPQINLQLKNQSNYDPLSFARMRQNLDAVSALDERIKSTKLHVRPAFLQRYVTNEFFRKWMTRFFILFAMTIIGLSANAYDYPYWIRILFPIIVIFCLTHTFNYFIFDDHKCDNFAFSYVLSSTLLMYITYWLYLQENQGTILHIFYHSLTFYGLYSVYCIKKVNPGFLKQQAMIMEGNNLSREKICIAFARDPRWTMDHFCVTCLIRRPLRSKHCPVDGSCVTKFDHHCTWLDACIGGRNYFYFVRVLTCGSIALMIWMYQTYRLISKDTELFSIKYLFIEVYDPWFIYILIFTTFNTIWVALMTTFHLVNAIVLGVTLNERLTGFRYSYFRDENTGKFYNPFRNNLIKNFLETYGLFRLMTLCRYTRTDWSQIYDINQIGGTKIN